MNITRRLFIRNTAAVGAVGATVAVPATAEAAPERTPHEQAIWHIRELERLVAEDGGITTYIAVMGHYGEYAGGRDTECRAILSHDGRLDDVDGMFVMKGGAA